MKVAKKDAGRPPEDEFRLIVERNRKSVYRLAYSYVKTQHDADDIFQEVFLKYLQKPAEFNDVNHEKRWFLRVTANACKSFLRLAWIKHRAPIDEALCVPMPETRNKVVEAVLELPPKLSAVIHLYYYEGYNVREAATVLGISEAAAQARLSRAKKRLAHDLKEGVDDED
ncbi:MAG: sigma-70 family RNA polymerase sigma factor [Clostridiales bacterium]|jgi:RNA polymerase sigma-70 factor (ECF subfamily)|nr:sigma-70 family RNA polymerase sigma factor [Clostridiales bacterium]